MIAFLFAFVFSKDPPVEDPCSAYNSSCLLCMQHNSDCFFCFQKDEKLSRCISLSQVNTTTCSHNTTEVDTKCVEMLGGDAVETTRYVIGSVIFVVGLIVDMVVRFWPTPKEKNEYAHL